MQIIYKVFDKKSTTIKKFFTFAGAISYNPLGKETIFFEQDKG